MTYNNVYAAYPAYKDGKGNGVEYITVEGVFWIDQCFATFKKHWAEAYDRVWQQVIKESEDILEKKHLHVVLLSEACSLIPIKVRKPICKDDGAYGYIWADKVLCLEEIENGTKILMEEKVQTSTSTHIETVKKYRRMARFLKSEYMQKKANHQKVKQIIIYE